MAPVELPGLAIDDLDAVRSANTLVWIDIPSVRADELDALGAVFGFDREAIEDILDVEQLPKYADYGDHVFVILHALTAAGDRVDTIELDVFIAEGLLVTVHSTPIVGIDWMWSAAQSHAHLSEQGADELFGHLAEVIGRRYFEIVHALEIRIDGLAEAALGAQRIVLLETQILRREEATLRQMLHPQRLALAELRTHNRSVIGGEAIRHVDDAYDVHNQVVEALSAARGLLSDVLDTYRGAAAERQANATTVLAVYSAVLLPLTLVVGWYGMNVRDLPAADESWGWELVTAVMVVFALASIAVFTRAGLIRLPRARDSRLGRGLASAARLPGKPDEMVRPPAGSTRNRSG